MKNIRRACYAPKAKDERQALLTGNGIHYLILQDQVNHAIYLKLLYFMKIGGSIMILMGIILFFDKLSLINSLLAPIFGDFQEF